jgi:hypothetical protein
MEEGLDSISSPSFTSGSTEVEPAPNNTGSAVDNLDSKPLDTTTEVNAGTAGAAGTPAAGFNTWSAPTDPKAIDNVISNLRLDGTEAAGAVTPVYERDVHNDLTNALARAAGFNSLDAQQIARANQGVDDNPATSPMHMRPWGDAVEIRRNFHFTDQARRDTLWQDFQRSGNLNDLGVFLHAQQDSFSHEGYGPRWGHAGAADGGHAPDRTFNDIPRADRMAEDSFNRLVQARNFLAGQGRLGASAEPMDYSQIRGLVNQFNGARTAAEKNNLIQQIQRRISGADRI